MVFLTDTYLEEMGRRGS